MATSSTLNRGYAPGSLAARPTQHAGGVRRRDESPEQFRDRMDSAKRPQGVTPPPMAPMPGSSRRDNIIAARADDSFDTKRNAYNQVGAATGHRIDEAGNIATTAHPSAPAPSPRAVTPPPAGTRSAGLGGSAVSMAPAVSSGIPALDAVNRFDAARAGRPVTQRYAGVTPPGVTASRDASRPVTGVQTSASAMLSPQQQKQFSALGKAVQISRQNPIPKQVTPPARPAAPPPMAPRPMAVMDPQTAKAARYYDRQQNPTLKPATGSGMPFSRAALGTTKPRAVMPPALAMLDQ